jgi:hypothetical protein
LNHCLNTINSFSGENKTYDEICFDRDCLGGCLTSAVIKNCEPLTLGPPLAIDKTPAFECLCIKFSSSNHPP